MAARAGEIEDERAAAGFVEVKFSFGVSRVVALMERENL